MGELKEFKNVGIRYQLLIEIISIHYLKIIRDKDNDILWPRIED